LDFKRIEQTGESWKRKNKLCLVKETVWKKRGERKVLWLFGLEGTRNETVAVVTNF